MEKYFPLICNGVGYGGHFSIYHRGINEANQLSKCKIVTDIIWRKAKRQFYMWLFASSYNEKNNFKLHFLVKN